MPDCADVFCDVPLPKSESDLPNFDLSAADVKNIQDATHSVLQFIKLAKNDPTEFQQYLRSKNVDPQEQAFLMDTLEESKAWKMGLFSIIATSLATLQGAVKICSWASYQQIGWVFRFGKAIHWKQLHVALIKRLGSTVAVPIASITCACTSLVLACRCLSVAGLLEKQRELIQGRLDKWEDDWIAGGQPPDRARANRDLQLILGDINQALACARTNEQYAKVGMAAGIAGAALGGGVIGYAACQTGGLAALGGVKIGLCVGGLVLGTTGAILCWNAKCMTQTEIVQLSAMKARLEFMEMNCKNPELKFKTFLQHAIQNARSRSAERIEKEQHELEALSSLQTENEKQERLEMEAKVRAEVQAALTQAKVDVEKSIAQFKLDAFFTELGSADETVKKNAIEYFNSQGAVSLKDILDNNLAEDFLKKLSLKPIPLKKARAFLKL